MRVYEGISPQSLVHSCSQVETSSLVQLEDQAGLVRWLWLGDDAGGLTFVFDGKEISIVTPRSPLGAALMGRQLDDVFELSVADKLLEYEVTGLY